MWTPTLVLWSLLTPADAYLQFYSQGYKLVAQVGSNLTNRSWGQFWPWRDVTRHYFFIDWTCSFKHCKACAWVRNHSRTNVGVKIDPRTCLALLFLGPVSTVKSADVADFIHIYSFPKAAFLWAWMNPNYLKLNRAFFTKRGSEPSYCRVPGKWGLQWKPSRKTHRPLDRETLACKSTTKPDELVFFSKLHN